jgi:hypothetical protein
MHMLEQPCGAGWYVPTAYRKAYEKDVCGKFSTRVLTYANGNGFVLTAYREAYENGAFSGTILPADEVHQIDQIDLPVEHAYKLL